MLHVDTRLVIIALALGLVFGACSDLEAIRVEPGALAMLRNGPRYWLIDAVTSFGEIGERRFFGELEMRRIASVVLTPGDVSLNPYAERSVVRDTEFVFDAESEVYVRAKTSSKTHSSSPPRRTTPAQSIDRCAGDFMLSSR